MTIEKSAINEFIGSVTEQTTLSVPVYYLFEFNRKASGEKYYCILTIAQNYGSRQLFNIQDTPSPTNSQVDLPAGDYVYKIYQQSSSTNQDPSLTTVAASGFSWVQMGVCQVYKSVTDPPQYSGAPSTNPVYEQV